MTDTHVNALAGLESALRDAAARAMKPEMPMGLAFGFFQVVINLARCLRQSRKATGLPRGLSHDLVTLLYAVRDSASRRVSEPGLTSAQALRLFRLIEGLHRAALLGAPIPEKAKKTRPNPFAPRPAQPEATNPIPSFIPRRRPDDYENIGAIAIRALDAAAMRNPKFADAYRLASGDKIAA